MHLNLRIPTEKEFQLVCDYIKAFELDNRDLQKEQFMVALFGNELLGFGRLRHHSDGVELCSLGVVAPHRRKGIGRAIVNALVKQAVNDVFLVCIIPEFFAPMGFTTVSHFPDSIKNKMQYCASELIVPETYVAMVRKSKEN